MEFKEWSPYYEQIVDKFDYNPEKEHKAAEILSLVLRKNAIKYNDLKELVSGKPVLVLGAGGTLDKDLIKLRQTNCLSKFITIATDGATSGIVFAGRTRIRGMNGVGGSGAATLFFKNGSTSGSSKFVLDVDQAEAVAPYIPDNGVLFDDGAYFIMSGTAVIGVSVQYDG